VRLDTGHWQWGEHHCTGQGILKREIKNLSLVVAAIVGNLVGLQKGKHVFP